MSIWRLEIRGPGDRCAEQVDAFIDGVGAEHREDEVADELFAHVLDEDLLDAKHLGLLACRLEFLALAEIGGKRHDFGAEFGLKPFQDDRGVEAAGIGEHDLLHVFMRCHDEKSVREREQPGAYEPLVCGHF
jgi:hypothetical protein